MHSIGIIGAGNIGSTIYSLLNNSANKTYTLEICDKIAGPNVTQIDFDNHIELTNFITNKSIIVTAGPYTYNKIIVDICAQNSIAYFDLTEDTSVTRHIQQIQNPSSLLAPQCGLAPGAVNIIAADLIKKFDKVNKLKLRVGALPRFTINEMNYYLTWSTEGLINEYCNPCNIVLDGVQQLASPLDSLETIYIDGVKYEAFNTSGGIATMCETYAGVINEITYKTIRYPGHRDKMKFLLDDLDLKNNKSKFVELFNSEIPKTTSDVIVILVNAVGMIDGKLQEKTHSLKIYGKDNHSAIQLSTASGVCSVINLYLDNKIQQTGFLRQESIPLDLFLNNEFGEIYA